MLRDVEKVADVGILIGRFQVHELTEGHRDLIESVVQRHDKVGVFLGNSSLLVSRVNPLDFPSRMRMLQSAYPDLVVLPLKDLPTDEEWSRVLDERIEEAFPNLSVLVYGSRDGFIPSYSGRFETVELEPRVPVSGTQVRRSLSNRVRESADFRHGVIYAAHNRYPVAFPTVDIALTREKGAQLALVRKRHEERWRFPGGFLDPRLDESLEQAAARVVERELGGVGHSPLSYLRSLRVDDWRYRGETDSIITTLLTCQYQHGALRAGQGVEDAQWIEVEDLMHSRAEVVAEHQPLLEAYFDHLKKDR